MKLWKLILVFFVLITVITITMPETDLSRTTCEHEYTNGQCNIKQCIKCGFTSDSQARHNWKRIGCSQQYCTVCGKTTTASHDYEAVSCTNKRVCKRCGKVEYRQSADHLQTYQVTYADCSYEVYCTNCNQFLLDGISHEWSTYEKHQNSYCIACGITAPVNMQHNLDYSFFGFFGFCKQCSHVSFQIPSVRYVCAFIGLLMSITAFVFLFLNRKRIRVQGGKYFRTVTPDTHLRPRQTEEEFF